MYDFDEFDEEYDADAQDDSDNNRGELIAHRNELSESKDGREQEEFAENPQDLEAIRRELEEVRRMKEELRKEIEEVRREKEARRIGRRVHTKVKHPRPPKPVRSPRRASIVDFEALTDSLEEMMEGLGEQIKTSLTGLKVIGKEITEPFLDLHTSRERIKYGKRRSKSRIEKVAPERIARVITPLASEERLKILDYLKGGGKTFNELELHTGKTGSSLTHHLNPLLEAGYVIKGEVRGTYYITVEGQLAYRLVQWLTDRLEREIQLKDVKDSNVGNGQQGEVKIIIEDEEEDDIE